MELKQVHKAKKLKIGEAENHLSATEARWFAVYVNYKREKIVADFLERKGIQHYLPLLQVTKRYTRKIKKYEIPLINCYIFVKIKKSQYVRVLETEHVLNFLKFSKNLISIPENEIQLLRQILGETNLVHTEPLQFAEGEMVEVVAGKLTGLKGKLISKQGKQSFLVALENIGLNLHVEVDQKLLQPIRSRKGLR